MPAHLIRTDAPDKEFKSAARTFSELAAALEKTVTARKKMERERMPQVVYTTEEWKQLKEYSTSRDAAARDGHAAARVQSGQEIGGAELTEARGKAEAFQSTRHFWKFDVEGWDRRLSLREVERAIQSKSAERLKLHIFLRPSRRETIQGQINYLQAVKSEIQKELAATERLINKDLSGAQVRYDTATKQAENAARTLAAEGKPLPLPVFNHDELTRMTAIATRNKDASLLQYAYDQVRDRLLKNPSGEALSRVKGHAVMARMEMVREAERYIAARQFTEFRQHPIKDAHGLDHKRASDKSLLRPR